MSPLQITILPERRALVLRGRDQLHLLIAFLQTSRRYCLAVRQYIGRLTLTETLIQRRDTRFSQFFSIAVLDRRRFMQDLERHSLQIAGGITCGRVRGIAARALT
jgi:hypothetical protein